MIYLQQYKMKKQNKILMSALLIAAAFMLSIVLVSGDVNYCCEKTTSGAWCQNAPQSSCSPAYKSAPTSCDSTSYCKTGCCFDSQEGLCMENTPQRVCEDSGGTWSDSKQCDIAQCNLGCCVLADQGAFVTLTRCKQLSGFYGIDTDFRKTIGDELTCIATASQADKGACVYVDPETASNTCIFTSRAKCKESGVELENATTGGLLESLFGTKENKTNATAGPGFYKDVLCTAEELGTDCAPSTKTMLADGKDEVYYLDTCGNLANIYDASRYNDNAYWRKVFRKEESCGAGSSNAGSASCGNCDYYLGSIGKKATRTTGFATYGDYICIDLSCKKQGKKHGESWCVKDDPSGNSQDRVGSKYYKEICLFDEVLTEPCADFRGEVCIEGTFNGFSEAACRVNRWQDCVGQTEQEDCENKDIRDCVWREEGYYFSNISGQTEPVTNDTNSDGNANDPSPIGMCLPEFPPGSVFWSSSSSGTATTPKMNATTSLFGSGYVAPSSASASSSSALCSMGNVKATFMWSKTTHPLKIGGSSEDWECNNSVCKRYIPSASDQARGNISESDAQNWAADMNEVCYRLGDCGGYYNWLGIYTDDGYAAYLDNQRVAGSGGAKTLEASTGKTSNQSSSSGGGLFGL
jgi:hypothetical protein